MRGNSSERKTAQAETDARNGAATTAEVWMEKGTWQQHVGWNLVLSSLLAGLIAFAIWWVA